MSAARALLDLAGLGWAAFDAAPPALTATPARTVRVGDDLRRQVARARPDWPSAADRRRDHAAHLRLLAVLDRVPAGDG